MSNRIDSGLKAYYAGIARFAILTLEEEQAIAIEYVRTRDPKLGHKLINANLRFVVKVALGFRNFNVPMLDLIQNGNEGLLTALKKFDPARHLRFITYASWWIRAFIQRRVIADWSLVKIGTTVPERRLFLIMRHADEELTRKLGRAATTAELAEYLSESQRDVEKVKLRLASHDVSVHTPLDGEDGDDLFIDQMSNPNALSPEDLVAERERAVYVEEQVRKALWKLKPREMKILRLRVLTDEPSTLNEIGTRMGFSRERVRQIQNVALRKMEQSIRLNWKTGTHD